ncbi:1460_t:CDS:2 [Rhizophagus irregularis]|nr:1460_t:CDS:2 [Rhizophagus irregularis]
MIRRERKKGPVWEHFIIVDKSNNSHPPVQCKYCSKKYERAVPERMQAHLNKCQTALNDSKLQSRQQPIIVNFTSDRMGEDQNVNVLLSPFKLQNNSEEINVQIDYTFVLCARALILL